MGGQKRMIAMTSFVSGIAVALLLACGSPLASVAFADAVAPVDGPVDAKARVTLASLTEGPAQEADDAENKIALRERKSRIRNLLCGTLDLTVLGPFVLGEHWAKVSGRQRQAFMEAFANTMVRHGLIIFRAYQGETFNIIAVIPNDNDPKLIAVEVNIRQSTVPLLAAVSGRIRNDWGDFKIIDIVGGGVSTALTLRKEYQEVIEESDGDVDGLIEKLRESADSTAVSGDAEAGCTPGVPL